MKLLLDTCVWGGAKQILVTSGHDVIWTGDLSEDPGDDKEGNHFVANNPTSMPSRLLFFSDTAIEPETLKKDKF